MNNNSNVPIGIEIAGKPSTLAIFVLLITVLLFLKVLFSID
jgi:hypothetical protein